MVAFNLAGEAPCRRRPYARAPRTVPRPARSGHPVVGVGWATRTGVRSAPQDPPDAPMVMTNPPAGTTTGRPPSTARPRNRTDDATHRRRLEAATEHPARDTTAPIVLQGRTWNQAVVIGLAAFVVSRLCLLVGAGVRAAQRHRRRPRGPRADARAARSAWWPACSPSGTPLVPGDRPQRLPTLDPAGHHVPPGRGPGRVLPALPGARARRRLRRCRAATRSPPSPSTSCSASPPCCSSATSPAGCTTTTWPSGPWCCSPCSPDRSCSRSPTPRRCSSCSPRSACGS